MRKVAVDTNLNASPVFFILHDNRSGSTLLASLLNRYDGVAVSYESGYLSRLVEYPHDLSERRHIANFVSYLFAEPQFRDLEFTREEVLRALAQLPTVTRRHVAQGLIDLYFSHRAPSARWRIIKHAPYPYLDVFPELLPGGARFIHIVRDGRAVLHSKRSSFKHTGRPFQTNLLKAALDWRKKLRKARHFADKHGDDSLLEIRYEDLVLRTEHTLGQVLDFLQVPVGGREPRDKQSAYFSGISATQKVVHTNVSTSPLPDRVSAWQQGLRAHEILLYEWICGSSLQARGYELLAAEASAPLRSRVAALLAGLRAAVAFPAEKLRNAAHHLRKGEPLSTFLRVRATRIFPSLARRRAFRND